jgi:predicted Zn-dependent protease
MNKSTISINQVLLFRDPTNSKELGEALWAAAREVENFYNFGEQRAVFRRSYLSENTPDNIGPSGITTKWSWLKHILDYLPGTPDQNINNATSEVTINISQSDPRWNTAAGMWTRTYDANKILQMVRELVADKSTEIPIVVTDLMLTPPPELRYVIWDTNEKGGVISIPPMDPQFWRIIDPHRISTIKHRVRTAFLAAVGEVLGLTKCDNEQCFLFGDVDSASCLDRMVFFGPEHNIETLKQQGFKILSDDPIKVQPFMENPEPEEIMR